MLRTNIKNEKLYIANSLNFLKTNSEYDYYYLKDLIIYLINKKRAFL